MSVITCGDCAVLFKTVETASVQLIVTSPPYNLSKEYERRQSMQAYLETFNGVLDECVRVLRDSGSICWQVGNYVEHGEVYPLDVYFYSMFKERGLRLRNRIVWTYGHGLHAKKRFSGRYETILWFTKGDAYTFDLDAVRVPSKYPNKRYYKGPRVGELSGNPLGKNPGDVWDITNIKHNHPEKTDHPCQFPEELVERLIVALSSPGDVVLDPFVGSGTTVICAERQGRVGIGFEKEPSYVNIARRRLDTLK